MEILSFIRIIEGNSFCNKYICHFYAKKLRIDLQEQFHQYESLFECQDEIISFKSHTQVNIKTFNFSCSGRLYDHLHLHGG